jgi:nucleotide-binding universal stress UspA family protein
VLEHILIAVDGSGPSRHGARFGLSLADQLGARATLLTVLQRPEVIPLGPMATSVVAPTPSEADLAAMRGQLDAIANEHPKVKVERVIELGPIAETIIDFATRAKADMIVLGARGLGPARRFLLGSVSDRVVHHAHCPVTVWR